MIEQDYFEQFTGDEPDMTEPQPWRGTFWYLHPDGMYRPYPPMRDYTFPTFAPMDWGIPGTQRIVWHEWTADNTGTRRLPADGTIHEISTGRMIEANNG